MIIKRCVIYIFGKLFTRNYLRLMYYTELVRFGNVSLLLKSYQFTQNCVHTYSDGQKKFDKIKKAACTVHTCTVCIDKSIL